MTKPLAQVLLELSEQGQDQLTPEQVKLLQELLAKNPIGPEAHSEPVVSSSNHTGNTTRTNDLQREDVEVDLFPKISGKLMDLMPPEATVIILGILYNEPQRLKILDKLYHHNEEFVRYCQVLISNTSEAETKKYLETVQVAIKASKERNRNNDRQSLSRHPNSDAPIRLTAVVDIVQACMGGALKIASDNVEELAVALEFFVSGSTIRSVIKFVPYLRFGGFALLAVIGTCEYGYEIYRYYKGEISGRVLARNICEIGASWTVGGLTAIATFEAINFLFTPIAGVAAAFVAGIAVPLISRNVIRRVISFVFNVPADQAVVDAYHYFKLDRNSSEEEIKEVFKKKRLELHPDKGGDNEEFIKMSMYMNLVICDLSSLTKKKINEGLKPSEWVNSTNSESADREILALPWIE